MLTTKEEREMEVVGLLGAFRARVLTATLNGIGVKMRATESDKLEYIERYRERGVEEGFRPDWDKFSELWDGRNEGNDAMAELLAEVIGVAHDEALAWIEDY